MNTFENDRKLNEVQESPSAKILPDMNSEDGDLEIIRRLIDVLAPYYMSPSIPQRLPSIPQRFPSSPQSSPSNPQEYPPNTHRSPSIPTRAPTIPANAPSIPFESSPPISQSRRSSTTLVNSPQLQLHKMAIKGTIKLLVLFSYI